MFHRWVNILLIKDYNIENFKTNNHIHLTDFLKKIMELYGVFICKK
jgi:hypothetical protein